MWILSTVMCYLHRFVEHINYTFQDFLIILFELLARITAVTGGINLFPQDSHSERRVWFYYIIMTESLMAIDTFIRLLGTLQKLLF